MEINTNNNINTRSYLQGIEETINTGRTASIGDNVAVTTGLEVSFLNHISDAYTEMGLPTLEHMNEMSADEVDKNIQSFGSKVHSPLCNFRGTQILFDIYAIMDLMQEMAQKMRDSLRELRNVENQTIQSNIRAQAAIQRNAAVSSMIAGAVLCAVQMAVTVVSAGKQIKDLAKQSAMMKNGGVDVMTQQNNIANSVGSDAATQKMASSIQKEFPTAFDEVKITEPDISSYSSQERSLNEAQGKLTDLTAYKELSEKQNTGAPLTSKESDHLAELQAKYGNDVPTQEQIDTAKTTVDDATKNLAEAKSAEGQRVMGLNEQEVQIAADEFKACRQEATDELMKDGKISPETQERLNQATAKFEVSRMKQVQNVRQLIKSGCADRSSAPVSVKANAGRLLSEAHNSAISTEDAFLLQKSQAHFTVLTGLNQAFGQIAQTIVSGIKELISASATELQANQKMQEDQLDQIKDLFAQELSVIQKVFQLFEAVTQKESSTIENIIMA